MKLTIEVKSIWAIALSIGVALLSASVIVAQAYVQRLELPAEGVSLLVALTAMFLAVVCAIILAKVEIAKKSLDLCIEMAKKEADEARRKEEDKKCDEASRKRHECTMSLEDGAIAISVEVQCV